MRYAGVDTISVLTAAVLSLMGCERFVLENELTISGQQHDFMKVLLGWYSTGNAPVTSYAGCSCYVRANNGHVTMECFHKYF